MDRVNQISMMSNTDALKEPRGFIKFLQVILAIFAFATTTAYHDDIGMSFYCPGDNETLHSCKFSLGYTFRLDTQWQKGCNDSQTLRMWGDYSSSSQFYVFVGVMAFLYSLAALALYVFADDKYHQNDALPAADLVITVIFVLLWLISSSAWADGLSKIKYQSDPNNVHVYIDDTRGELAQKAYGFTSTSDASYASLNVSIIFGFLNMLVWAGNIWFLYKETKWFGGNKDQQSQQQPQFTSAVTP